MDEHSLFAAIGGVDDVSLRELEQPKIRRLPRRFGLIAAMLALLLTACAAPVVMRTFDKIQAGAVADNGQGYNGSYYLFTPGEGWSEEVPYFIPSDVELEIAVDSAAPDSIETRYLPLELMAHCQVEAYTDTDSEFSLSLSMKAPGNQRAHGIYYRQYALPENGHMVIPDIFGSELLSQRFYGTELQQSFQTYGDIAALEFNGEVEYEDSEGNLICYDNRVARFHTKYLFWSDGLYLYCMKIPVIYPLRITDVEQIVTSLTPVGDISEYLPNNS